MKHYTKEELELYRNGKMSLLGRINCAAHLKNCPECTEILKEIEEDEHFLADLRNSIKIYDNLPLNKQYSSISESSC